MANPNYLESFETSKKMLPVEKTTWTILMMEKETINFWIHSSSSWIFSYANGTTWRIHYTNKYTDGGVNKNMEGKNWRL